jgi:hypothetical protein
MQVLAENGHTLFTRWENDRQRKAERYHHAKTRRHHRAILQRIIEQLHKVRKTSNIRALALRWKHKALSLAAKKRITERHRECLQTIHLVNARKYAIHSELLRRRFRAIQAESKLKQLAEVDDPDQEKDEAIETKSDDVQVEPVDALQRAKVHTLESILRRTEEMLQVERRKRQKYKKLAQKYREEKDELIAIVEEIQAWHDEGRNPGDNSTQDFTVRE